MGTQRLVQEIFQLQVGYGIKRGDLDESLYFPCESNDAAASVDKQKGDQIWK
jgi:hypothetical protein